MKLHDVLESAGVPNQVTGPRDVSLTDLVCDSRAVTPGSAFVAIRGFHVDGHDYIAPALSQGASAIFAETMPPADLEGHVAWVRVTSTDDALGHLAAAFHGHPSERIEVMAVTGTNGKTTVSWLVEAILKHAGHRTGLVGTIETHIGEQVEPAVFTTPFGDEMQRLLGRMRDAECSHAILEASSHGLKQDRVAGVRIAAAGFTNLSRDHLDFHLTMDDYQASKKRLFSHYALAAAINIDDPVGAAFADDFDGPVLRLSVEGDTAADVIVTELTCELNGCRAVVETPDGVVNLNLDLVGKHNVENALVALGMCRLVGVPFAVGAKVQGMYPTGRYYSATVAEVHDGGTAYTLNWDDGDTQHRRVVAEHVRPHGSVAERRHRARRAARPSPSPLAAAGGGGGSRVKMLETALRMKRYPNAT